MRPILLASTVVLTILVLTHPALVWATDSLTIEANPMQATITRDFGGSVTYTITVGSSSGLPVTFGVTGLPSGATAAFNPPWRQPPVGGTTTSILTVTMPLILPAPIGSYPLNVTARDDSGIRWIIVTLNVAPRLIGGFGVSVYPNSLTIKRTESKTAIVTVFAVDIVFSEGVPLSVTGLPTHVTVTFIPPVAMPPAGGEVNSTMRLDVGADALGGIYPLKIVGVNANVTLWAPFTLTVWYPEIGSAPNVGIGFAFIGIGLGVAVAGVGVAFALSGRRGSEVIVYGGWYYCRKHRVPLLYVNDRLWCPIEQRYLRTE